MDNETFRWASILAGLAVTVTYALKRFDQPTFHESRAMPRTIEPLRFLFLKPAYPQARRIYVLSSILVYLFFVWIGPQVLAGVGLDVAKLSPGAWPLFVALVLVGLLPNVQLAWANAIEERVRRAVHEWYLVPEGVSNTITSLVDASFKPPRIWDTLTLSGKEKYEEGLTNERGTLRNRAARAVVLVEVLLRMKASEPGVLGGHAFRDFEEDFEAIVQQYRAVRQDIDTLLSAPPTPDQETALAPHVDSLLQRTYAFISWAVWHQANTAEDVRRSLAQLGLQIVPSGGNVRVINVILPAIFLAGIAVFLFSLLSEVTNSTNWAADTEEIIVTALRNALASAAMYGIVVFVALKERSRRIDQGTWHQWSATNLIPIGLQAGLASWGVIAVLTLIAAPKDSVALVGLILNLPLQGPEVSTDWSLGKSLLTAFPWVLVGSTASMLLAWRLGGDARATSRADAIRDAAILGFGTSLAVILAVMAELKFRTELGIGQAPTSDAAKLLDLATRAAIAFACGAVIGLRVPSTHKGDLVRPRYRNARVVLDRLLRQAEQAIGNRSQAEEWVFTPNDELDGILPAEAVRSDGRTTGVFGLLEDQTARLRSAAIIRLDRSSA